MDDSTIFLSDHKFNDF